MSLGKKVLVMGAVLAMVMGVVVSAKAETVEELQEQIAALQEELNRLLAQLAELQGEEAPSGCPAACEGITSFDRNLMLGMTGDDVKCLQAMLNMDEDTKVAETGAGSPGNETTYFGPLTRAAVVKFQEKYAEDVLAPWGLTSGTGYFGSTSRAKMNELLAACAEVPPEVVCSDYTSEEECTDAGCYWYSDACHEALPDTEEECVDAGYYWYDDACHEEEEGVGALNVSLAADTPASATIIADSTSGDGAQALIPFITVNFENNGEGTAKVTELKFTRTGVASDTDLSQLYLFEGDTKLADYSSFSDKVVTFSDSEGLFEVAAGETVSVTLKADLANGTSAAKTIGFELASADDITTDAESVSGDFPISGNLMTTATVSDLGKLTVAHSSYNTSPDPGETDYDLWEFKFTCSDQDVEITRLIFTNVGTIDDDDLQNLKVVDSSGNQYGETLAQLDGGVADFDLSDDPISLEKGDVKYYYLKGDIVGGTNRTFRFSFQNMTDIRVRDTEYDVYLKPNQADSWSIIQAAGSSTIQTGTLTITRSADSPSGNIAKDATSIELARFDLTASGEDIKITSLDVYVTRTEAAGGTTNTGLDNVKLYLDGSQKDTTRDITGNGSGNATTFSFGNTFVVKAGETSTLSIKADVKDASGTSFDENDTIQIHLAAGSSNAQGKSSLTSISTPAVSGLTLTVKSGALTAAKNTAMPDATSATPTGVPGSTDVLVASFTITAGAGEGVDISAVKLGDTSSAFAALQNIVVKTSDGTQIGSTRGTVSAGSSYYFYPSPKISLDAAEQLVINVYADIKSGASTGDNGSVDLDEVRGTGQDTGSSANYTTSTAGQTIYIASTGSLTISNAADMPVASMLLMGATDQVLAKYKFQETSGAEDVTVTEITLSETGGAATADILNIDLYDGDTLLGTVANVGSSGNMSFSGLNWTIPAGTEKYLTVKADVNVYGAATSDSDIQIRLNEANITARGDVSGTSLSLTGTNDSNTFEIWKAIPTITTSDVSLDGGTLTSGANNVYRFEISASGGTVDFYQWKFTYSTSGVNVAGTWKLYNNTEGQYEDTSCTANAATGVITCVATSGEEIAAGTSETYTLSNSNITGVDAVGDSISVYMNSDTSDLGVAAAASVASSSNIVWSDEASTSHSTGTTDWTNGYLLENDDEYTATQTLSK